MALTLAQQAQKATDAMRQGRFGAALKIARMVLKSDPKQGFFANLAGLALVQTGDAAAAVPYFRAALRAGGSGAETYRNLAQALIHAGAPDKAEQAAAKALEHWPRDAGLLYLVASARFAAEDPQGTIAAVGAAIAQGTATAGLHHLRALAQQALGDTVTAETDFRAALALAPLDADVTANLAELLARHARGTEARMLIDQGIKSAPSHAGLVLQRANLQQADGDTAGSIDSYNTVLAQHPGNIFALNGLAYLVDPAQAPTLAKDIGKALRDASTGKQDKVLLGFAQAEFARRAQSDGADRLLTQANAAASRDMPYDGKADQTVQDRLMAPFLAGSTTPCRKTGAPRPVFVIGLIRSGTTLAEQVLSAHSAVSGLGELSRARHLADRDAAQFAQDGSAADGDAFAENYRLVLPALPQGTTHIVDKMPDNFRVIEHLLNAFPDAVVIEMQRDPRDVALSMWASFFPTRAHSYANALPDMARHMNLYARTLRDWRALFPDQIHAVGYTDLVQDLPATSRRLAALCGLEWQETMLHPERNNASVMTASAQQVRQPVHTRSLDKWRDRTAFLEPLTQLLDADLWPMVPQH